MERVATTGPAQLPYFGGPWFMSPFLERELEQRDLDPETAELVRRYAEHGYVILDDVAVDDSVLESAATELAPLHEGGAYNRVMDAWTVSEAVRAIATDARITSLLETLYGRRPVPFQTLNFRRGSQQETHSDSYHFHSYPKHFMCGVWVALEDIDETNGPVHYYPGSHRLPDYEFLCPGRDAEMLRFVQRVIESYGLVREQATLKRGQALIWAANLLHGGDAVTDPDSTRLSQVTHYYFEDCSYYTPFRSDFERGRVYFRQIVDVGSGRSLPLRSSHGRLSPPIRSRMVTWRRRLQRVVGRGYVRYEI